MENALFPCKQGMITTRHRDNKSYQKYNQHESKCLSNCAMHGVFAREVYNGSPVIYSDALQQEKDSLNQFKVIFLIVYLDDKFVIYVLILMQCLDLSAIICRWITFHFCKEPD